MLALYRSGRQAEALEAYRRVHRNLDEQLGIEPGPALRELERRILNQDESLEGRAPVPSPSRRSWPAVALVAGALLLAAAAVAALLVTRDSSGGLSEVPPNSVGVIDAKTNTIVAAIPVGLRPGQVAGGAGSVWVGNLDDRNLTKIDPQARSVEATISLDNRTPTGLALGAGALWVAHGLLGELSRVEPQFGRVTHTIIVAGPTASPNGSVAVGDGYVWTAYGDSTLARIQPAPVRLAGSTLAGSTPSSVAVGAGGVWVANAGDATVQRFNPTTFEEGPLRTLSVGRRPTAVVYGAGALWVANAGDDSVTRIDPDTGSTISIRVGDEPDALAVGAGAVWVANSGDGTVSRIDAATNEVVRTIDVGSAPAGIAVAGAFVWVTIQAP